MIGDQPKFRKGDRVRVNEKFLEWDMSESGKKWLGRTGTILGVSKGNPLCWRVRMDHQKKTSYAYSWHWTFLSRIKEERNG
jgi:hypothetical protein